MPVNEENYYAYESDSSHSVENEDTEISEEEKAFTISKNVPVEHVATQIKHGQDMHLSLQARRRETCFLEKIPPPQELVLAENSESNIQKKELSSTTNNSLVLKPHSDLAVTVSNIATVSKVGLDLAGVISKIALETAKFSTRAGLDIARTVTGVMSERMVQATSSKDGAGRLIDASTTMLHRTLSLTEQVALAGLEFTSETVQLALGTATESMNLIDTLFGTTDAAKALAEFVQLVKREWTFQYDEDGAELDEPFGIFHVMKALTAWACLQYVTSDRWERDLGGWKKVKLVDLWDMLVGELTPREELSEFKLNMDEDRVKRLSNLFLETTKRYSNPYLEEYEDQSKDERLFSLLHNLKRYSKFSSSAYDNLTTAIKSHIPFPSPRRWKQQRGTLHRFAFASSTDLSLDSIVDSSHHKVTNNKNGYQPTYFLIRDHTTQSIILALRGTMSVHDLIVDLTCEYEDFQLPEDIQRGDDTIHQVHKGMFKVAKSMATPGQSGVFEALKREMEANKDYGLILVGHSLGAGVASLLALLLASPSNCMTTRWSRLPLGRRVHAYAFATPCVMSAELSRRTRSLITSVAYGNDVICRLSLGHVLDLRNMVRFLGRNKSKDGEAGEETASKIIKKVLDYQSRKFGDDEKGRASKAEYESWFWKTRLDVCSHMQNLKLYPAGKVYWIVGSKRTPYCEIDGDVTDEEKDNCENNDEEESNKPEKDSSNNNSDSCSNGSSEKEYMMLEIEKVEQIFQEIGFSPHMIIDHLPFRYGS
ncbi:8324_t:CDS:2 [Acaulospora morrowiae]|uniref:sn-1-specific diacylglycerol lipase n=1 Tax=Acaulospora morrowiae TaxID=94023 RepID=A0A9N9CKF3_9GLOM|nr:8324_t:CDS:2 [Acaulospora morrowiae]